MIDRKCSCWDSDRSFTRIVETLRREFSKNTVGAISQRAQVIHVKSLVTAS